MSEDNGTGSNHQSSPNGQAARPPLVCRGVRGAITVADNTKEEILSATREMLSTIATINGMKPEDIASVFFTTTPDLNAEYPALAARQLGWLDVALMCSHEMDVQHGLKKCVRVMIHWNTSLSNRELKHIYLRDAVKLRPDRSLENNKFEDSGIKQEA